MAWIASSSSHHDRFRLVCLDEAYSWHTDAAVLSTSLVELELAAAVVDLNTFLVQHHYCLIAADANGAFVVATLPPLSLLVVYRRVVG